MKCNNKTLQAVVREINGERFIVHAVKMTDTLSMLSLKYHVGINVIRTTNNLLTDNVFSRQELLIPMSNMSDTSNIYEVQDDQDPNKKRQKEVERRDSALTILAETIKDKNQKANYSSKT